MFGTAIICIDGRIQGPVAEWLRHTYGLEYVDVITEPGVDRELAHSWLKTLDLKAKAEISARAHASRVIAVVGHEDCAGNPVSREEHYRHISRAVEVVYGWRIFETVVGLWAPLSGQVELVDTRQLARSPE